MKPFIKWVGGKGQILDKVFDNFPSQINNYFEPFVGGGSVLLELLNRINSGNIEVSGTINVSDKNSVLIHMYLNIKNNYSELFDNIQSILTTYTQCIEKNGNKNPMNEEEANLSKESYYYWIRKNYNLMSDDEKNTVYGSAVFIFLNKTGFRGLYRIGPNGLNVPFGNYHNLKSIVSKDDLERMSTLIQNVNFTVSNFEDSLNNVHENDFVYLDPPYVPVKKTSFVNYQSGGFNDENHKNLFSLMKDMNVKNVKFLMSNSDAQIVKDTFESFIIKELYCRRAINSKKPDSVAKELFIKNFEN